MQDGGNGPSLDRQHPCCVFRRKMVILGLPLTFGSEMITRLRTLHRSLIKIPFERMLHAQKFVRRLTCPMLTSRFEYIQMMCIKPHLRLYSGHLKVIRCRLETAMLPLLFSG